MERNTKVILIFFLVIVILVAVMYFSVSRINNNEDENAVVDVSNGFFPALGSGSIKIIEFSDFACSVCGKQEPVLKQILKDYEDRISFYYRNFPLSIHENSFEATLASMCADEQDKFWEYHDILFENQIALDKTSLRGYAQQLNLDMDKFNSCLDEEKYKKEVNQDFNDGKKAGVKGTPTFFVNGKRYEGFQSLESLNGIIKQIK